MFARNCSSIVNALNDILSFGLVDTDPDALLRVYHLAALEDEKYLIQEENVLSRNEVCYFLNSQSLECAQLLPWVGVFPSQYPKVDTAARSTDCFTRIECSSSIPTKTSNRTTNTLSLPIRMVFLSSYLFLFHRILTRRAAFSTASTPSPSNCPSSSPSTPPSSPPPTTPSPLGRSFPVSPVPQRVLVPLLHAGARRVPHRHLLRRHSLQRVVALHLPRIRPPRPHFSLPPRLALRRAASARHRAAPLRPARAHRGAGVDGGRAERGLRGERAVRSELRGGRAGVL